MNGNDYLEIEEQQHDRIEEDYINDIKSGKEPIPDDYKVKWIDLYLEGE